MDPPVKLSYHNTSKVVVISSLLKVLSGINFEIPTTYPKICLHRLV